MPELPIQEKGAPYAFVFTTYSMLSGGNIEAAWKLADAVFGVFLVHYSRQGGSLEGADPRMIVEAVANAPPNLDISGLVSQSQINRRRVGHEVLQTLLQLSLERPRHVSLEQAAEIVGFRNAELKKSPTANSKIREHWRAIKPFSHFLLAAHLLEEDLDNLLYEVTGKSAEELADDHSLGFISLVNRYQELGDQVLNIDFSLMRKIGSLAMAILDMAATTFPHGGKAQGKAILSFEECWTLPDGWFEAGLTFELPELTANELAIVDRTSM